MTTSKTEFADLNPLSQEVSFKTKKQKTEQKLKPRKKNGCRSIHYSCHSPHLELHFCRTCDAYTQIRDRNVCECCEKTVAKFLKHTWLTRVLKFGIKQHANYIRDWTRYPDGAEYKKLTKPYKYTQTMPDGTTKEIEVTEGFVKKPRYTQFVEIRYRRVVYELEIKYLALALEIVDSDLYIGNKLIKKGGEKAKLDLIQKNIVIKGFGIRSDGDEADQ